MVKILNEFECDWYGKLILHESKVNSYSKLIVYEDDSALVKVGQKYARLMDVGDLVKD